MGTKVEPGPIYALALAFAKELDEHNAYGVEPACEYLELTPERVADVTRMAESLGLSGIQSIVSTPGLNAVPTAFTMVAFLALLTGVRAAKAGLL